MTKPYTTYRRADGKAMGYVPDDCSNLTAFDAVETRWEATATRTVRLGADEKCGECDGTKQTKHYRDGVLLPLTSWCWVCNGTGVKPRDLNPAWTEVQKEIEVEVFLAPDGMNGIRIKEETDWQKIADSLANHLKSYVCHCNLSKCKCGYDYVMDEYESAIKQEKTQ